MCERRVPRECKGGEFGMALPVQIDLTKTATKMQHVWRRCGRACHLAQSREIAVRLILLGSGVGEDQIGNLRWRFDILRRSRVDFIVQRVALRVVGW